MSPVLDGAPLQLMRGDIVTDQYFGAAGQIVPGLATLTLELRASSEHASKAFEDLSAVIKAWRPAVPWAGQSGLLVEPTSHRNVDDALRAAWNHKTFAADQACPLCQQGVPAEVLTRLQAVLYAWMEDAVRADPEAPEVDPEVAGATAAAYAGLAGRAGKMAHAFAVAYGTRVALTDNEARDLEQALGRFLRRLFDAASEATTIEETG